MRFLAGLLLLSCGCAGPSLDEDGGECFADAEPAVKVGRIEDDTFEALSDGDVLAPFASPQGGFGVLLALETKGVGVPPEHTVTVDIAAELGGTDGERIALYHLADAPLMCDGPEPGLWGTLLLTLDQERFVTPTDLDALAEHDVVLEFGVVDETDERAEGTQRIRIQADP